VADPKRNGSKTNGKMAGKMPGKLPVGTMVPQPHGGALRIGGPPGPHPGAGRPKDIVRQASLLAYHERIPVLTKIADSEDAKDSDKINAVMGLAKVGLSADPPQVIAAAQGETPDGFRFSLVIGERQADDE